MFVAVKNVKSKRQHLNKPGNIGINVTLTRVRTTIVAVEKQ